MGFEGKAETGSCGCSWLLRESEEGRWRSLRRDEEELAAGGSGGDIS